MKKILFFTGTRAEYGLLSPLMRLVNETEGLELQIVATNMHLSPDYGLTYREIETDGFKIDRKVEMLLSSDTPTGTAKSLGLAAIGMADALQDLKPDLVVILGDRYEMLAAAQTALIFGIPIAHIHGGEVTKGAIDDQIRNAITVMSTLHFTSTELYRQNVIGLGAKAENALCVGALGVETITSTPVLPLGRVEEYLHFSLNDPYLLVTFHPETATGNNPLSQTRELTQALSHFLDQFKILITLPNSDAGGRSITKALEEFAVKNATRVVAVKSLGQQRYLSALKNAIAVVGNSSSGLIEAPSLGTPTVNIGSRQEGRVSGVSVVNCNAIHQDIIQAIDKAVKIGKGDYPNPYYKPGTANSILTAMNNFLGGE